MARHRTMPKKRQKPRVSIRYQDDDLLTAKEVAKYLKVTEWTVYQWAQKGRVPCIRLSKRALRFRFGDIKKELDRRTTRKA